MNRPPADLPEPLLSADATDFERRVLRAAQQKAPSPMATERMAKALGLTAGAAVTTAAAATLAAEAAITKAGAAVGASTLWPWISVGVLGIVVGGAVVGTRVRHASLGDERPAPISAPAPSAAPLPAAPTAQTTPAVEPPASVAPSRRTRTATTASELAEQIAFIDGARAALSSGADRRALELVRRYQETYPMGSFRPEATALRIEALVKLGRQAEARTLAERFVAEHRGSLLAARVAELAGLTAR